MSNLLITVLGPTAVGKTRFAVKLAEKYNGEIISADSRQVYRHMDIGTGKDLKEYSFNGKNIPYHLIDILNPTEEYNLFSFQKDFEKCFDDISLRRQTPFLVGGTGMYLSSILQNYKLNEKRNDGSREKELQTFDLNELKEILLKLKPDQHNVTDLLNRDRIIKAILIAESVEHDFVLKDKRHLILGVVLPRDEIKNRITHRLKDRLKNGMIDEAKKLLELGVSKDKLKFFGLEYKFLVMHINGELNYNDMYQKLNSAIHSFAKRQMTWFRKMQREGVKIIWLSPEDALKADVYISKFLDT